MPEIDNILRLTNIGVNGVLLLGLYKIWGEYIKSQAAREEERKSYIALLERCIQTLTTVSIALSELKDK